jgi:hypothetical protein
VVVVVIAVLVAAALPSAELPTFDLNKHPLARGKKIRGFGDGVGGITRVCNAGV